MLKWYKTDDRTWEAASCHHTDGSAFDWRICQDEDGDWFLAHDAELMIRKDRLMRFSSADEAKAHVAHCHRLSIAQDIEEDLEFRDLRIANLRRCEQSYCPVDDWSPTDWACAAAGD